jgi:hypothetical protein
MLAVSAMLSKAKNGPEVIQINPSLQHLNKIDELMQARMWLLLLLCLGLTVTGGCECRGRDAWLPNSKPIVAARAQEDPAVSESADQHGEKDCFLKAKPASPSISGKAEATTAAMRMRTRMTDSCRLALDAVEDEACSEFNKTKEEILNWSPHSSSRYSDTELGMSEYVRPLRRGTGGTVKARWGDFRVTERCLDGADAALADIDSVPAGQPTAYLRFVLLKVVALSCMCVAALTWLLTPTSDYSQAQIKQRGARGMCAARPAL